MGANFIGYHHTREEDTPMGTDLMVDHGFIVHGEPALGLADDFYNLWFKNKGKKSYEALIDACKMRFRPVIMTGFSTVIGIIPLILGSGAGFESRLTIGIVLISGIIFSIFLTLFVTPFFYTLIEKD